MAAADDLALGPRDEGDVAFDGGVDLQIHLRLKRVTLLKAGALYLGAYLIMVGQMIMTLVMAFFHLCLTL